MNDDNIFKLKNRNGKGPPRAKKSCVYTQSEKVEKLEDYLKISPDSWRLIKYGTHVRYVTKEGRFLPGGFVLRNPFDTKPQGQEKEKRFLKLRNGFNAKANNYREWIVAYEDVEYMYAKISGTEKTIHEEIKAITQKLNTNMRRLAETVKKIEKRVSRLEKSSS